MRIFLLVFTFCLLLPVPPAAAQEPASLNLRRGHYREVPSIVWNTPGLSVLDLSKNPLTGLPDSIARLPLTHLILQKTYVTDFPASVKDSPLSRSLELLDMRGCRMTEGQQDSIRNLFPDTKILWDFPCECGAD